VDHIPFLPGIAKRVIAPIVARRLQAWDLAVSQRPNVFLAISRHIAGKVRAYYQREAQVVYPPVRIDMFYPEPHARRGEYFLMVGRLLHYKRFDLGIRAAEELRVPLKVVGRGPEAPRLKRMANPRFVEFIEGADDDALRMLYTSATALVFPQIEDFGLVAVEALACGTPVVAYARGGGGEIIKDGVTGALFHDQSLPSLKEAMNIVMARRFDRSILREAALAFAPSRFRNEFFAAVRAAGVPVESTPPPTKARVPLGYAYRR
jgi:glycosyltransferase involved in cell wall biosynthesis